MLGVDIAEVKGDFFETRHFQRLALFDDLNERGRYLLRVAQDLD